MPFQNYLKLADAVSIVHCCWIVLMIVVPFAGVVAMFALGEPRFMTAALIPGWATVLGQIIWGGCPLTALERACRARGGQLSGQTSGSFICDRLKARWGIDVHPLAIALVTVLSTVASSLWCWTMFSF